MLGDYYFEKEPQKAKGLYYNALEWANPLGVNIYKRDRERRYGTCMMYMKGATDAGDPWKLRTTGIDPKIWLKSSYRLLNLMKHDEVKGGSIKNMHFHPGFVVCSNVMDVISQNSSADEMEEWNKMYGEILVTVSNLNRLFCFDSNGVRILLKEAVELGNTDAILRLIDVAGEDIWDHRFGAEMDTLGVARLSRKENIDDIIKYSLLAAENGLDKNASTKVMRELIKSELALMEPQSGISIRHPSGYIPPDIEEVILLLNALLKIEPQDDYALEKLFDLRFSSREYQMAKTLIDNNPQKNAWFKNYINNEIEALMEKNER